MSRRSFWSILSGLVLGGFVFRVLYVLIVTRHEDNKIYDSFYYELQALALSKGHFFEIPFPFSVGRDAAHPPLTSIVITPATYLFGLSPGETPQRLTMAVLGALVVLFVGVMGRTVYGSWAGLIAAATAAGYPNIWIPNGILMSETLVMLLMALTLLACYRVLRVPNWRNAALLGLACGAEMLVRAELILLVPFLLLPVALTCTGASWKKRFGLLAMGILVVAVTVGPWVGRNLVTFRDTTFLSTGEGPVLLGANCPQTYGGPILGSWSLTCSVAVRPAKEQSVESTRQYDAGKRYIEHHYGRVPLVMLARVGRVWDMYEPIQMARADVNEGRPVPASLAGLFSYYALLPAALVGAVALRRRRTILWPLLVPAAVVTIIAATGYGQVRFRAEFEVCLVVLASVGLCATSGWIWRRMSRGAGLDRLTTGSLPRESNTQGVETDELRSENRIS